MRRNKNKYKVTSVRRGAKTSAPRCYCFVIGGLSIIIIIIIIGKFGMGVKLGR